VNVEPGSPGAAALIALGGRPITSAQTLEAAMAQPGMQAALPA
jgi:hypothetical protein